LRKSTDETSAYHEAGHVVGATSQGLTVRETSIVETETIAGFTQNDDPDLEAENPDIRRIEAERAVITLYAGEVAQRRFSPRSVRRWQAVNDLAKADALLQSVDGCADIAEAHGKWLQLKTEKLIEQRWHEVEAVAEALVEERSLNEDRIARLIRSTRRKSRARKLK